MCPQMVWTCPWGGLWWVALGEQGTSACQIYLIIYWDNFKLAWAKMIDDDLCFVVEYPVIWLGVVSVTLLLLGRGSHLLYHEKMLLVYCWVK